MNGQEFWQVSCYLLVFLLFSGFTVLDGFDLGVGMLLPFFPRAREHKRVLLASIWPVWDGNELWGLAAVLVLFAAFPSVYALALEAAYPVIILLFLCLILRPVLFELRFHAEKRMGLWDGLFAIVSLLLCCILGAVFGSLLAAPAAVQTGAFPAVLARLCSPQALLGGLLWVMLMLLQGCAYLVPKTDGDLSRRIRMLTKRFLLIGGCIQLVFFTVVLISVSGGAARIGAWLGVLATAAAYPLLWRGLRGRGGSPLLVWASAAILGTWVLYISVLFPDFFKSSDMVPAMNLYNASSGIMSLQIIAAAALFSMAIVVFYTVLVYRRFRGRVDIKY